MAGNQLTSLEDLTNDIETALVVLQEYKFRTYEGLQRAKDIADHLRSEGYYVRVTGLKEIDCADGFDTYCDILVKHSKDS